MPYILTLICVSLLLLGIWLYQSARTKLASLYLGRDGKTINSRQWHFRWLTARKLFALLCFSFALLLIWFAFLPQDHPNQIVLRLASLLGLVGSVGLLRKEEKKEEVVDARPNMVISPNAGTGGSIRSTNPGEPLGNLGYVGQVIYPRRMHVGRNEIIKVLLERNRVVDLRQNETFTVESNKDGSRLAIQANTEKTQKKFLEVELKLSGLDQKEPNPQRCDWGADRLSYRWSYDPPKEAIDRKMVLVFKLVGKQNIFELGTVEEIIQVKRIDHLSYTAVMILAAILLIVGAIGTVISAAKDINDLTTVTLPTAGVSGQVNPPP